VPTPDTAAEPPRNLVLFCDGTGHHWGGRQHSHVVRLARACVQDAQQCVYYDAGVGSAAEFPGVGWWDRVRLQLRRAWGLAFGRGIYENIAEAYGFIVRHARPGDRIFLVGFSRGAFTVRAVAGMVNLFGIVRPQAENLVPQMLRVYFGPADTAREREQRVDLARAYREQFAAPAAAQAWVHFVGVLDTVESVGGLVWRDITSDNHLQGKHFRHVRHALALDERRAPYRPRLYDELPLPFVSAEQPSFEQRWFPGAHSDIAGGHLPEGGRDAVLPWLATAAQQAGLRLKPETPPAADPAAAAAPASTHDQALASHLGSLWALTGLMHRQLPAPPTPPQAAEADARLQPASAAARRRAGVWLAAVLGLLAVLGALTPAPAGDAATGLCGANGACQLALMQLRAAWLPGDAWWSIPQLGALRLALWLDLVLIGAYTLLACHLTALAHGRWRHWRRTDAAAHRRLRWALQVPLVAAPVADLLENLGTAMPLHPGAARGWAVLLSVCAGTKLLALALLGVMWAISLRRRSTIAA
jgi:Uncharacterized alpha/beta hydrolase domain (DUF2235)